MVKGENDRVDISALSAQTAEAPLWRLVYVSNAKPRITDDELNQILLSSRIRNFFTHDVTGMLMLAGGSFCQILEGTHENVTGVFERIKGDTRHSNVRMLELAEITERSFPNWTMGPPSRTLREFSEAADVDEFFQRVREREARFDPEVRRLMMSFHAGELL